MPLLSLRVGYITCPKTKLVQGVTPSPRNEFSTEGLCYPAPQGKIKLCQNLGRFVITYKPTRSNCVWVTLKTGESQPRYFNVHTRVCARTLAREGGDRTVGGPENDAITARGGTSRGQSHSSKRRWISRGTRAAGSPGTENVHLWKTAPRGGICTPPPTTTTYTHKHARARTGQNSMQ